MVRPVLTALLGLALGSSTLLQIRFGLAPLLKLRSALSEIRRGQSERILGEYPRDIAPLAQELNLLLDTNQEILQRARTQVGNLAHALKTPLSVISNEARHQEGPLAAKVIEQAEIMRTQITHHLDRARVAARSSVIGDATEVQAVLSALNLSDKPITVQLYAYTRDEPDSPPSAPAEAVPPGKRVSFSLGAHDVRSDQVIVVGADGPIIVGREILGPGASLAPGVPLRPVRR